MTTKNASRTLVALALTALVAAPASAFAAVACTFTADLQVGSVSEEVRCLQRYLNGEGFTVAETGVGSAGRETTQFQAGTKAAVTRWQLANLLPGTGYFGPASRAKYQSLATGATPSTTTATTTPQPAPTPTPAPAPTSSMTSTRLALLQAQEEIDTAQDDLDDADLSKSVEKEAQERIDKASAAMLKGLRAFLVESYGGALDYAVEAKREAKAAQDLVANEDDSDDEDEEDSNSKLTFAQATIFTNETVVMVEYDGDEIIFTTDEEDEDDIVDEILDEVDSRTLTAGQVEDELEIDEEDRRSTAADKRFDSGSSDADERDAEHAIEDAEDAIDEADDTIRDADADGDDVDEARDLLDEAEDRLDDAQDAFDDEDWDEAVDLAQEAEDLADEAVDAID